MNKTNLLQGSPFLHLLANKRGQTLVEYALILSFISIVATSVLIAMGSRVTSVFTTIDQQVAIAGIAGPPPAPPTRGD